MTQGEAVIQTLEKLDGIATLGQLYQEVFKIKECEWNTKTPFASIRRIVQTNKDIYKIKPGLYALTSHKSKLQQLGIIGEADKINNSTEAIEFNHSYYQGLLVEVGNLKGLNTFVPNQDKNKYFIKTRLFEISRLKEIPKFSYSNIVQRSSTVDVIWFNERQMPHSFFEVEHSTDIQNSLLKFNDLQDFYARMIIVADDKRKQQFLDKIKYSSFKSLSDGKRVSFLSYEALNFQYESLMEHQKFEFLL